MFMRTLEMFPTLEQYLKMMQVESVCSEVSSFILRTAHSTEEQQFAVYKQVAESMAGKKVIIRTLDIGADKQVDYFNLDKEENPALGIQSNSYLSDKTGNLQDSVTCFIVQQYMEICLLCSR